MRKCIPYSVTYVYKALLLAKLIISVNIICLKLSKIIENIEKPKGIDLDAVLIASQTEPDELIEDFPSRKLVAIALKISQVLVGVDGNIDPEKAGRLDKIAQIHFNLYGLRATILAIGRFGLQKLKPKER